MAGTKRRASCRELFTKFNILLLASKFLLSLSSFVADNTETFQTNSDIHNISTRYRYNLHVPKTNLSKYQKGVYYSGIKLFNNLPPTIKSLNHDIKKIKPALKEHLLSHSYSVEFTLTKNSQPLQIHVSNSSDAFLCSYCRSNSVVDCKSLSQLCNLYLY
jgi:hypothetical protein